MIDLIKALPIMLRLLEGIFLYIKKITKEDPAKFMKQANEAIRDLSAAETQEQRLKAGKKVKLLIKGL